MLTIGCAGVTVCPTSARTVVTVPLWSATTDISRLASVSRISCSMPAMLRELRVEVGALLRELAFLHLEDLALLAPLALQLQFSRANLSQDFRLDLAVDERISLDGNEVEGLPALHTVALFDQAPHDDAVR